MPRTRKKTETQTDSQIDTAIADAPDVFDEAIAAREAAQETAQREFVAGHHVENAERPKPQAEEQPRKKWTPPKDPFGYENQKAGENRVELLKSEGHQAWVIRFAHNPNLDTGPDGKVYSKENPHPVLKMLKEAGYRWGFDRGDDKGGWGKEFTGDAYGADHIEARKVLQKAADIIGQKMDQGRIPD